MSGSLSGFACPAPDAGGDKITLAHGEGGRLMRRLIQQTVLPRLGNEALNSLGDAAILQTANLRLAVSTDSYVVSPLFFPGGDIGKLAVFGTVNDLAVSGAKPLAISLAMILEEGLPLETLERVLASVASAAAQVGVPIVTGDTKVVPRHAADSLFLNTTGIGEVFFPIPGPDGLCEGDEILVTGPVGRHGMAVMTCREGLEFNPAPTSDCAPLLDAVTALQQSGLPVRAMRDATRGGLAAVLHEWAQSSRLTMAVQEAQVPVTDEVRGACELLGLDPIHVANEGTMVVAVAPGAGEAAVKVLRRVPHCEGASRIGQAIMGGIAPVVVRRVFGPEIPLDEPLGAPLPRIC